MNWSAIAQSLATALNTHFEIISAVSLAGGDIHQAYKLHTLFGDGGLKTEKNFFIKLNQPEAAPMFASEAFCLQAIQDSLSARVPKVIHVGENSDQAWLLLEYIPLSSKGDDRQRGKDLALMHHHTQKTFGWPQDNFIGHTPQINTPTTDWIEFYGQHRLAFQLELAQQHGAKPQLIRLGHALIEKLPAFFQTYHPEASLLHGDLWGGNAAFDSEGEAVFFDPASYYGDRETDLAMTELFGGFSTAFYQGYNEVFPLDAGYSQRKPLYQLYHQLNHFNLFGGHYEQQSINTIQELLMNVS